MLGKRKGRRTNEGLFGIGLDPILGLLLAFFTFALVLMLLIRVGDVPPLRIHTETLPDAVQYKPYAGGFAASGGIGPYTYKIKDGELPPGLFLDEETGLLRGVPGDSALTDRETSQTWEFTLMVNGSTGEGQSKEYSLTVCPVAVPFDPDKTPLAIIRTDKQLPFALTGKPYETFIGAKGGIESYRCEIEGLPPGLSADGDGRIYGAAEQPGDYTLSARLRDQQTHPELPQDEGSAIQATRQYELSVYETGELKAYPLLPRVARRGARFRGHIAVFGGQGPYRYRLVDGALPEGLRLDSQSGFIVGEPETVTEESIEAVVRVVDVYGEDTRSKLSIRVLPEEPAFAISLPDRWADARQNEPYAIALSNRGGVQPIRWQVEGLPEGLRFDQDNRISGRPTASPGQYQVSITAEDAIGQTTNQTCSLMVRPPLQRLHITE